MGPIDFLNHMLNLMAPAFWLALVVTVVARLFIKKKPVILAAWKQSAINFAVCSVALGVGLWFFGNDGKMMTYAAMTLLCATSQWLMSGGWRA